MEKLLDRRMFIVAPVRTWSFTYDVSPLLATRPEFLGRVSDITELLKREAAKSVALARKKDSPDDVRAAVGIKLTNVGVPVWFTIRADMPDPVPGCTEEGEFSDEEGAHIADMDLDAPFDGYMRFVSELIGSPGLTAVGANKILISWKEKGTTTIIHELGHLIMGAAHKETEHNIMKDDPGGGTSDGFKLDVNQAKKYSGL